MPRPGRHIKNLPCRQGRAQRCVVHRLQGLVFRTRDRPTLVSIMCCRKTPHDAHGGVEPCPCARCYRITGTLFQQELFPRLEGELGPMGERYELFVAVLELVRVEALLPYFRGQVGRPEEDRAALARAFIAKAVFDIPTTRALIERLEVDGKLCRLCGRSRTGRLPSACDVFAGLFRSLPRAVWQTAGMRRCGRGNDGWPSCRPLPPGFQRRLNRPHEGGSEAEGSEAEAAFYRGRLERATYVQRHRT